MNERITVAQASSLQPNGEQFAQIVPIGDDQSVLPASDPSSGGDFRDVSIDSLPGNMSPLALMAQDILETFGRSRSDSGADFGVIAHAHAQLFSAPASTVVGSAPGIGNIPAPGGAGTQVFEAGLLASRGLGESDGTHAGNPAFQTTTRAGTISFTSPDGVDSVTLGGSHLNGTSTAFPDGTKGSLTAWFTFDASTGRGAVHYSYTLLDNTVGIPNASFALVVTDLDGDHNPPANLVISIVDDGPVAAGDTDAVGLGQLTPETGNVILGTGASGADMPGADGGLTVVSATGTGVPVAVTAVGSQIAGEFGTLTLFLDGHYSYLHTGAPGGGTDTFTYTINDADGSRSTATLQIAVGDSAPGNIGIPTDSSVTTVFEAGLLALRGPGESAGSDAGNPDGNAPIATQTGKITFTSVDGVGSISLGGQLVHLGETKTIADGTTGELHVTSLTYDTTTGLGEVDYIYTLLDNMSAVNGGDTTRSFTVAVTDADGTTTSGNDLVITIKDDKPTANPDTIELAGADNQASGTVTTNDVLGADGPAPGGAVVGIASNNNGTIGTVGVGLTGADGTLTIDAQGQYTYTRTSGSSGTDVFTYTIRDGDGTQSNAMLTFTVDNAVPGVLNIPQVGNPGAGTLVDEAGLPTGSNPAATSETTTGVITFTSPDGVGSITIVDPNNSSNRIVLDSGHTSDTLIAGPGSLFASYTIVNGSGTISYTYTLRQTTSGDQAVNGGGITTSFNVTVADSNNDQSAGTLVIDIKDDKPIAKPDTDVVPSGQLAVEHGNVFDGTGTTSGVVDILGADGAAAGGAVVGVAFGSTTGTVGQVIHGAFGDLTLFADGHYNYQRFIGAGGGDNHIDTFTYTIQDGDGSQATATLNVTVANSTPGGFQIPTEGDADAVVFEAGLPARGNEPAGSNSLDQVKATGTIEFTSADGIASVTVSGQVIHLGETRTIADGTAGQLDITSVSYDANTGLGQINYTYTLLDNTIGNPAVNNGDMSVSFAVTVSDLDGNSTTGGNLIIDIVDDKPVARPDTDVVAANQTAPETGNVLSGVGTGGGPNGTGVDIPGADDATVVSVAINNTIVSVDPTAGGSITGGHGTLTIDAHGNYSYVRSSGGTDIFTYTIQDGDGSQSSSTLTIVVGASVPNTIVVPQAGGADTTVFEAGLLAGRGPGESAGSHAGDTIGFPVTTQTGTITFNSLDGVSKIQLGGPVIDATVTGPNSPVTFTDATGSLTAFYTIGQSGADTIRYTYTLLDNTLGDSSNVTFPVTVTDRNGHTNQQPANLVINIVDDAPVAKADADSVAPGQAAAEIGNVINGAGSGGADARSADDVQVVGLVVNAVDANVVDVSTVGTSITGLFGKLTLNADGSYHYNRNIAALGDNSHIDTFSYTLKDADGDLTHSTLTINVADSTPVITSTDPSQSPPVFEAGLPARGSESAGSHGGDPAFPTTEAGKIFFSSMDGISLVSVDGHTIAGSVSPDGHTITGAPITFSDSQGVGTLTASFTYDVLKGQGEFDYGYHLVDNAGPGQASQALFHLVINDLDTDPLAGGSTPILIQIVDDQPSAQPDGVTIAASGGTVSGNVITGVGTDGSPDILGADGAHVSGVTNISSFPVTIFFDSPSTLDTPIRGSNGGMLTLHSNGNFSFDSDTLAQGAFTFYTYTLKDSDAGDASSGVGFSNATLTFSRDSIDGIVHSGFLVTDNGSDNFAISASSQLSAGDFVHGTGDAATTDTLRLDAADTYNLATSGVTNIDSVVLGNNAAGSRIVVGDAVVATADFNKDGVGGDLQLSAGSPLSSSVTIDASSLTGSNHIVVDGLKLDGNDTLKGGAGDDILASGKGSDTLTGGAGANHFQYFSPLDGGTFANQAGADHIVDFNAATGDVIDILGGAFGNLAPNTNVASIFGSSATDAFASPGERLHFNTETHTLLYDSNGSSASGMQAALAVFDNHAIVAATNIHVV